MCVCARVYTLAGGNHQFQFFITLVSCDSNVVCGVVWWESRMAGSLPKQESSRLGVRIGRTHFSAVKNLCLLAGGQ